MSFKVRIINLRALMLMINNVKNLRDTRKIDVDIIGELFYFVIIDRTLKEH